MRYEIFSTGLSGLFCHHGSSDLGWRALLLFRRMKKMSQLEKIQFTMEIIRTVCPVVMVILQIAIITGLVIMGDMG